VTEERYKLKCTYAEWYELTDAIDKARDGSIHIKVSKAALMNLMRDHSHFIQYRRKEVEGDT
jgi:hypothetical protein